MKSHTKHEKHHSSPFAKYVCCVEYKDRGSIDKQLLATSAPRSLQSPHRVTTTHDISYVPLTTNFKILSHRLRFKQRNVLPFRLF